MSGITSLCYRRLHDRACAVTGRPFEPADQEGWERHQAALRAAAAAGAPPQEWLPIPDNLESGNQSMMMAEGWKDAVLRWLQARSLTAEIWGDMGRCREIWGDVGRCREMGGDIGGIYLAPRRR